jgi:HK97 family phage major capsid protein
MIAALRARLAALHAQMVALQQTADTATPVRALTADEASRLEALGTEFDSVKADLERRLRMEARTTALNESAGRRVPVGAGGIVVGGPRTDADPMRGFRDMHDFAGAVRIACQPGGGAMDPRLQALRSGGPTGAGGAVGVQAAPTGFATESSGADQGFLVPPEMRTAIWELVFAGDDLINMIQAEPTASNTVEMLADETTPWGALGIKAKWRSEAQQMVVNGKPVQDPRSVRLQEMYAFITATNELLEDAPRLANRLTEGAARAIRWLASDAIMWGTGVGQILGWMTSAAKVTIAAEGGQATNTVVRQNLAKMYARLLYMGTGRARWLTNRDVLPALLELSLGNNGLFMLPQIGIAAAPQGAILGLPLAYNEHCKTLGTSGDLQLVDMDGMYLCQKSTGIRYDTSIHLFFDYGLEAFRWTFRIGGQPFLSGPVSPANGAATRSHFVVLADRP